MLLSINEKRLAYSNYKIKLGITNQLALTIPYNQDTKGKPCQYKLKC